MVTAHNSTPLVSVVMAVWNDPRWLRAAIDSVLDQSVRELELVVVDDGSTDETVDILADAGRRDPRVRLLRVPHQGAARALNAGIELARADFVARLDADDLSHPRRLERQLALLKARPEIGIAGTDVEKIDEEGSITSQAPRPETDSAIRFKALLWCPFTHSSVVLRRGVLAKHGLRYDSSIRGSEDYELWTRLLEHTQGCNLAERLVQYRVRQGFSQSNYAEFAAISARIALRTIERWVPGYSTTEEEVVSLRTAFHGMGNAKPPAGREGWLLTRRYLELLRAWQATQSNRPENRDIGSAEARRFRRALAPGEGFQVLPLVSRLAMLDSSFPLLWARYWLPRLKRSD